MRRLSFDQSTSCTGYAVFEDENLIDYGKIKIQSSYDYIYKLKTMLSEIESLINQYKPNKIIFENIQNQASKNIDTFKKLSGLFYGVMLLCEKYNIDYQTYYSSEWRKAHHFPGKLKRKELKEKSKALIKELYNIDVVDDISDSVLLGLCDVKLNKSAF